MQSTQTIERFAILFKTFATSLNLRKLVLNELFDCLSNFDINFLIINDFNDLLNLYFCWECNEDNDDIVDNLIEADYYENSDNFGLFFFFFNL